MAQVKCYALATEQQLAMQDALEKDDRTKFLEALNSLLSIIWSLIVMVVLQW